MRTLGTVASLKWAFRGSSAATAWAALLDSLQTETDGMVLYFEDPDYPRALIRDTTTPANSKDVDANSVLTMTSPALKRVMGADGTIKYANHNLCLQSQDFSTTWNNINSSETVNVSAAPDGTTTADKITENTVSGLHYIRQTLTTVTGQSYIASVYLKKEELSWAAIGIPNLTNGAYYVDLTNGVEGTVESAIVDTSVTSVGNGWYRCTLQFVATGTTHGIDIFLATANNTASYTGTGTTRGIYAWGAQVKAYPVHDDGTLSDYVPTTTAARYRLPVEYDTAGDPVGLLVEEARTNLCTYSEDFSTTWTNASTTETVNATTAPDGTTTADAIYEVAATAGHAMVQAINVTSGTTYTESVYVKGGLGRTFIYLEYTARFAANSFSYFDIGNGTVGTLGAGISAGNAVITDVGGGWYRCSITGAATGTGATNFNIGIASADNAPSYLGDITKGIYLWGAQLEAGSFPSSYIRTTSATVTRAADNISLATSAMPYLAATQTYVFSGILRASTGNRVFHDITGSGNWNRLLQQPNFSGVFNTGGDTASTTPGTPSIGSTFKQALAFAEDNVASVLNGGTVQTDNTCDVGAGTATFLYIGANAGTDPINGHIKYIKYLPRRVSNNDLQSETA